MEMRIRVSMQHIFLPDVKPIPRRMPIFHDLLAPAFGNWKLEDVEVFWVDLREEQFFQHWHRWQNLEPKMSTEICQLDFLWLKGQSCEEDTFENVNV